MSIRPIASWLALAAALVLLLGCMKTPESIYAYDQEGYGSGSGLYAGSPAEAPPPMPPPSIREEAKADVASSRAEPSPVASNQGPTAPSGLPQNAAAEDETTVRKVHYDGWARIRASRTDELVDQISKLAIGAGGQVDSATPTRVTVRVPVARFQEIFDLVLKLGEVLDKSISAEDITEAYAALDLRLATARATRERLQTLLARAREETEKLEILQQIQRLTEEIDLMDAQIRMMASMAAFSQITVEAVPRQAVSERPSQEEVAGLEWLTHLSPFRRDVAASGRLFRFDVPAGFVALDEKHHFVAESADGATIWTCTLKNEPEGDSAFWIDAIKLRLGPEFASSEVLTEGSFLLLRLVDSGDPAYRYLVGVRARGDDLDLIEVYFPAAEQEERYQKAVFDAIAGRQG
jgi:hypothetical protein